MINCSDVVCENTAYSLQVRLVRPLSRRVACQLKRKYVQTHSRHLKLTETERNHLRVKNKRYLTNGNIYYDKWFLNFRIFKITLCCAVCQIVRRAYIIWNIQSFHCVSSTSAFLWQLLHHGIYLMQNRQKFLAVLNSTPALRQIVLYVIWSSWLKHLKTCASCQSPGKLVGSRLKNTTVLVDCS